MATRFGLLAEGCLAFLLFPVLRGLALFRFLGIQFEASIKYHTWLGTAMLFFATFHGASTLFIWGVSHYIQEEVNLVIISDAVHRRTTSNTEIAF